MLKLQNGFLTLNGKKHKNLNATERIIFNLLFADQKNNLIELCNPKKELSLFNLKNQNYEFRRLHRGNV
jgi:hypothetical protein